MEPTVAVTQRGEERIRSGHFWVYRADVAGGQADSGAVVRVVNSGGRFLARVAVAEAAA